MRTATAVLAVAAALVLPIAAQAACNDVAAPGVQWRRCVLAGSQLVGVDLSHADLRDAGFGRADLSGAVLRGADMRRAKLVSTRLVGTDLEGANLTQADLTSADLSNARLNGASLRRARLFGANLRGADLTSAVLEGVDMLRADLSGARWIDGTTICADGSLGQCMSQAGATPAPEG